MGTRTSNNIKKEIAATESKLAELKTSLKLEQGKTKVTCRCGRSSAINTLVYVQTHWYVKPYGCTGGDYYNTGEGQWDCPKCGRNNRLYDQPEIEKLKHCFKSIHQCYCTQDRSVCSDRTPCTECRKVGRTRDGFPPHRTMHG